MNITVEYTIYKDITKIEKEVFFFQSPTKAIDVLDQIILKYGSRIKNAICIDRERDLFSVTLICNKKISINLEQPLSDVDIITLIPRLGGG